MGLAGRTTTLPRPADALPGRTTPLPPPGRHFVNGQSLAPPYGAGLEVTLFGLGCFWGAERRFWQQPGVQLTAVGYAAGHTPNPTYEEVCSGMTGHAEVVQVVFDPALVSYPQLLQVFWESHDPTQGMRQGNDIGTQYRSGIYCTTESQRQGAEISRRAYQAALAAAGHGGMITTEIAVAPQFYFAEDYHQQYLSKNPNGYCPDHGTGVACPVGLSAV